MHPIRFGPQVCGALEEAASREWLVTDGLGGFAMGTVAGLRTRRYHGLLVVATEPPIGRHLGLAALDPVLVLGDQRVRLATHEWGSGTVSPAGYRLLTRFDLDDGVPRWRWQVGPVVLEAELAMVHGRPAVGVLDRLVGAGSEPVRLEVEALCTWRDVHGERWAWEAPTTRPTADGFVFEDAYRVPGPGFVGGGDWCRGVHHREEAARGLSAEEDLWFAGRFAAVLTTDEKVEVEAWSGDLGPSSSPARTIIAKARRRACEVTRRAAATADDRAGTLARETGRHEEGRELTDRSGSPTPSADVERTGDADLGVDLLEGLHGIVGHHIGGTCFGIRVWRWRVRRLRRSEGWTTRRCRRAAAATKGGFRMVRNARAEASARLGGLDARVLEPSPPASPDPNAFTDDPVDPGFDKVQVSPVEGLGERTWMDLAGGDADLAAWCAPRGLAGWPLPPLPDSFPKTRAALHALGEHVVAAARYAANGKIGLRFTKSGFGTPFFGDDRQVRVEAGALLVDEVPHPLTTLGAAAGAVGVPLGAPPLYTHLTPADPALDLGALVDPAAAGALGAWYGFAWSALEQLRHDTATSGPSRVQLWPEHFDPAVDAGDEAAGNRASFGASPGDEAHDEPYLYVSPWVKRAGEYWNDPTFQGASLGYAELRRSPDPRASALVFLRSGFEALA